MIAFWEITKSNCQDVPFYLLSVAAASLSSPYQPCLSSGSQHSLPPRFLHTLCRFPSAQNALLAPSQPPLIKESFLSGITFLLSSPHVLSSSSFSIKSWPCISFYHCVLSYCIVIISLCMLSLNRIRVLWKQVLCPFPFLLRAQCLCTYLRLSFNVCYIELLLNWRQKLQLTHFVVI